MRPDIPRPAQRPATRRSPAGQRRASPCSHLPAAGGLRVRFGAMWREREVAQRELGPVRAPVALGRSGGAGGLT